jgi:class 3 adenylate cyclase
MSRGLVMSSARDSDPSDVATSASDNRRVADPPARTSAEAVMAHVLFIDIVGSSRLATDRQFQMVTRLQQLVQATDEFQRSRTGGDLVSLPTGDGMALVFFRSPEQPAGCAVEVTRALRKDPFCQVRMGVHSGLVFLIQDINGARNVSGDGINQAERVMSCGGAGHILLSDLVATPLRHLSHWKDRLHDAGICGVKDGTLHLWSLHDADVGSAAPAQRLVRFWWPRKALISAAALVVIAGVGASVLIHPQRPTARPTATPPTLRSLSYSLLIKTKSGEVRPLAREMMFPPGYRLRFQFTGGQNGFLYVVNEGPPQQDGAVWTWLFPYPAWNQGSSALSTLTPLLLPPHDFIQLDKMEGQEKVYVIWSDHEIPELQGSVDASEKSGQIRAADLPIIRAIISKASPDVEVIKADTETVIRGNSSVLVKLITLEHM